MPDRHRMNAALVKRLFVRSQAERWRLSAEQFEEALDRSIAHAFAGRIPEPEDVDRYLESLQTPDLALAAACAAGHEVAWDHFMREYRPVLYRAADAIDPSGGARDLADALYADLFGLKERDGERQSLLRYFHGRSSLATWLRAVLSQRHVDRIRVDRRMDPLPDDDATIAGPASAATRPAAPEPERARFLNLMRIALAAAITALAPRDRLRLGLYYAQDMTLAVIGRSLGEHEGTVSRHLTRTRAAIRAAIDRQLRQAGLDEPARAECFRSVMDDAGSIDLAELIGADSATDPGAGPSTEAGAGPSSELRAGPSTELGAGKVSGHDRSR